MTTPVGLSDEIETELDSTNEPTRVRTRGATRRGVEASQRGPRGPLRRPIDPLAAGSIEELTDVDPERRPDARIDEPTDPPTGQVTHRHHTEPSAPLQVISMKGASAKAKPEARQHRVQVRALSEVRRAETQPQNLGFLAPPRDPRAVRARRVHDLVVWGSVVVIVGCLVMLAVWFLARH
ncbi:MAG: hypothetical protein WKG01_09320 [Kofleriaceae bacterium]